MSIILRGKAWIFGNNIDTDQIYPGRYLELTEHRDIAKHAMEGIDPSFATKFPSGDIIVAGENFGCGSSREHAVITLKGVGVSAIVARSFARIFYRNAINLGVPVISCVDALSKINNGDEISVNLHEGIIQNINSGCIIHGDKLSDYVLNFIKKGGAIPVLKESLEKGQC